MIKCITSISYTMFFYLTIHLFCFMYCEVETLFNLLKSLDTPGASGNIWIYVWNIPNSGSFELFLAFINLEKFLFFLIQNSLKFLRCIPLLKSFRKNVQNIQNFVKNSKPNFIFPYKILILLCGNFLPLFEVVFSNVNLQRKNMKRQIWLGRFCPKLILGCFLQKARLWKYESKEA